MLLECGRIGNTGGWVGELVPISGCIRKKWLLMAVGHRWWNFEREWVVMSGWRGSWVSGVEFYMAISGVARTIGAHGQRTLRGPSACFITLFLWTLPHRHPYSDFTHVYLYYMILNTALFNQYTSHGLFLEIWVPLMTRWGEMGPLYDAMINGILDNIMGN